MSAVILTRQQGAFLAALMARAGQSVSFAALHEALADAGWPNTTRKHVMVLKVVVNRALANAHIPGIIERTDEGYLYRGKSVAVAFPNKPRDSVQRLLALLRAQAPNIVPYGALIEAIGTSNLKTLQVQIMRARRRLARGERIYATANEGYALDGRPSPRMSQTEERAR